MSITKLIYGDGQFLALHLFILVDINLEGFSIDFDLENGHGP